MRSFDTIMLRFRDLATNPGETIRRHKALSTKSPVLWGWWHKAFEKVPLLEFQFAKQLAARPGGWKIYLFDTQWLKFYEAVVVAVHFDGVAETLSPDPERTPEYYRFRKCLAWFELKGIGEESDESAELAALSHVATPDFFADDAKRSEFEPLDGQPLGADKSRLERQSRTIWFLKAVAADARVKSTLDPAVATAPAKLDTAPRTTAPSEVEAFPSERYELDGNVLLWLSDLHFGMNDGEHAVHAYPFEDSPASKMRESLRRKMGTIAQKEKNVRVAAVIVSGDLTWKAEPSEFNRARDFLNEAVASGGKTEPHRLVLCPGNHDLKFSDDPANRLAPLKVESRSVEAFSNFYELIYRTKPNDYLAMGRHFRLRDGQEVDIVCLNSSLLTQVPNQEGIARFQGHGWLGQQQLEYAATSMKWNDSPVEGGTPLRVVVVHHHLLPVVDYSNPQVGDSYSTLLDADRLTRWLIEHRVRLLLHGHMHEPFIAQIRRGMDHQDKSEHEFAVCGMGSTGVTRLHRRDGVENFATLIEFDHSAIRFKLYEFNPHKDGVKDAGVWQIPRSPSTAGGVARP